MSELRSAPSRFFGKPAGIYSEPPLDDPGLKFGDWVYFSTGPFPPDAMLFSREEDLRQFVTACLGSGVFRNLELYQEAGGKTGHEYACRTVRGSTYCDKLHSYGDAASAADRAWTRYAYLQVIRLLQMEERMSTKLPVDFGRAVQATVELLKPLVKRIAEETSLLILHEVATHIRKGGTGPARTT